MIENDQSEKPDNVWEFLNTAHLDQLQVRFLTVSPIAQFGDNSSSTDLSRSTSFATESLIGAEETEAGRSEKSKQLKGSTECGMGRAEFASTICNIVGDEAWFESANRMFSKCSNDGSVVRWSDLLDFYINLDQEKSKATIFQPLHHDGDFKAAQHSRRETIVKIICVSTGTSYVYIITSKFGHVGIYDDKLRLQRKYEIDIDTDPDSDLDVAASDPGWITDAVWMDNSKHMVYTSSLRTIHFFDASASVHYEEYRGFGLKNIPLCVDYWFDPKDPDGESLLMFGDDGGSLTIIRFSQPPNSLFKKDEVDSVQTLFWSNMEKHSEFAQVQYNPGMHTDGINGIHYLAHNKTVVTSSRDPHASIIIMHIADKLDSYIFKLAWGVRCFDLKQEVGVLATGSNDMMVRLWNPVVTSRPTSVLGGHKAGIMDIKLHAEKRLVFSYSKDAVIKLWDLDKANIIQTIGLHFPSFSVLGKEIEFGRPGMYVGAGSSETILVICCEHLTELRLLEEAQVSQDVALLTAPDDKADEKSSSSDEEASGVEELEGDESVSDKVEKTDITNVITFKKIKEDIKQDVEVMIEKQKISKWSSIREIVRRRKLKKLDMDPNQEMPDFNRMPLPKYEPFKIFTEPKIGAGEKTLNQLRVEKYLDTSKFKQLAKDNMPFMALEIHGLQEVKIAPGLPLSENMINAGLKLDTIEDLLAANLDWKSGQIDQNGTE